MPYKQRAYLLCALVGFTLSSHAQNQESDTTTGPYSLDFGLGIEAVYNDNIYRLPRNEVDSWIGVLAPSITATAQPSKHRYELSYEGDYGWYTNSSDDDYVDHYLSAGAYLDLSPRNQFEITASYSDAHEDRGSGINQNFNPNINIPAEPDRFDLTQLLGIYTFGAEETKGRLVFQAGYDGLEYSNNRLRTQFFDQDLVFGEASFFYRVLSKTSLVLTAGVNDTKYDQERLLQPTRDNTEYSYLLGVTWDTTAKTTGTVLVGYLERRFDDPVLGIDDGPIWQVDVEWSPRTYSVFDFSTARRTRESDSLTGDFVVTDSISVTWTHGWGDRLESQIGVFFSDEDYRSSGREDDIEEFNFTLTYQMRHWLSWNLGVDIRSRDSTLDRQNYDQNIYRFGASIAF